MTTETTTTETTTAPPNLRPFPFVNDWRRGCWVARPTGKGDAAFVFGREFCTGTPHKASGMVRYTLADLGGPGWIVAKDAYRVRHLVRVTEIGWELMGELPARDILAVVQAGEWDGTRCTDCGVSAIVDPDAGPVCAPCQIDANRAATRGADIDPEEVPF